ncbi:MAG: C39 family peptidase [Coprobacillus sp.]
MKVNKKKLARDFGILGLLIFVIVFAYAFYMGAKLNLKQKDFVFEYGEEIPLIHETFLSFDEEDVERKQEIIKNTEIVSNFVYDDGCKYPKIGDYEVTLTFRHTKEVVKVTIKDTEAPSIIAPESIEVLQDEEIEEETLNAYFKSKDLSENSLSFDLSQYDKSKAQEQTIKIIAKDIYDNQTIKNYTIKTIEKPNPTRYTIKTVVDKDDEGNVSKVYIKKTEKPFQLDVKLYCQHDVGARMGCDPAALYQAIKYKGYCKDVSLRTFIEDMPISSDNNPNNGFYGDPFSKKSLPYLNTIFPQPMSNWAKKYGNVVNISVKSVDDIIDEIRNDNPVVVWVTYNFRAPKWQSGVYGQMYSNIHCFTVSGYNPQTQMIRVSDPGGSRNHRWVSKSTFEKSYNYKKFAVVVR